MMRATRVVSGPLALKMQRVQAAREGAIGLEIVSLPQLAARLAGGFMRPATTEDLQPSIRAALEAGNFAQLERLVSLPGMIRAVQQTLTTAWRNDTVLAGTNPRLVDLAWIDAKVRTGLPPAALVPPDLRDAAVSRIGHAYRLFGSIELAGLLDVDPVWRPLINALVAVTPVAWSPTGEHDRGWFTGRLKSATATVSATVAAVLCADPEAEVVEALRWARKLMAEGVPAAEIGLTALSPDVWDDSVLVLARSAGLPMYFTHGISALEGQDGQACAALADILLRGLSQVRVRRLLLRAPRARAGLPDDWAWHLRRSAGLFTLDQWATALEAGRPHRASGAKAERVLLPRLAQLAAGIASAEAAGEAFLHPASLALWREALRAAPAEALEFSLPRLRTPDPASPGTAVSWGPAWHLAAQPRSYVRLLGLTGRAWPRARAEDPLLPDHVRPASAVAPIPRPEQDEQVFRAIVRGARGGVVLSRSRRSAEGALMAPSRLFPTDGAETLAKVRTPAHAFSEADRLLARPQEARDTPQLALGRAAWRAWWTTREHTDYDGRVRPDDPVVRAALDREQSATSARRLLRDPLGFVWAYALGWRPAPAHTDLLTLDAANFGELVHELIRRTVQDLEPEPGLNRASAGEIEVSLQRATATVLAQWPAQRPVPPPLLWRRTVDSAARLALNGLLLDDKLMVGTRSFSEVPFGRKAEGESHPWSVTGPVSLGGLRFGGRIDRLDLRGDGVAARVTDYKSGSTPRHMDRVALGGGVELQRVIYAAAVRMGMPEVRQVVSRLVYLRDGPTAHGLSGDALEEAIVEAERFIATAEALITAGTAPPGPDVETRFNAMRLALPAELDAYLRLKAASRAAVAGELPAFWQRP